MRFSFVTSLLAAATIACCAIGCSAPADDSSGAPTSDDEEINSTTNKMGMRLVYDEPTGRVHATVKTKLRGGEKLLMRVRRGRLVVGGQTLVDCTQLADAPAMTPPTYARTTDTAGTNNTTGTTGTTATKVVYVGPEVDRALLASVYSQQWIDGNISQDVLERLSREGADAIVEACILTDASVRMRLQTSIQDAWDAADPNTAPALRAQKLAAARVP